MKVDLQIVTAALKQELQDPAKVRAIIELIEHESEPEPGDEDKLPPVKKQFSVIVYDRDGTLPANKDFVASIVQIPENESVATVLDRLYRAAYEYNATRKGRLLPLRTLGEAIENLPSRFTKDQELWVKTKTPVLVVKTNNEIPTDKSTD